MLMLHRTAVIFALAGSVLFACGCQGKPAQDDVSIQKSLHEKGTASLMDEVAKAPDYHPSADGQLTDAQVKMYLDVRQREQQIREVAFKDLQGKDGAFLESLKTVGDQPDTADIATADLRAAQELGFNPKEYQWVKERVLEARMLETTRALAQQVAQSRQQVLALFEQRRQEATDPVAKAEAERQLEELQKNAVNASAESDPVREHNAGLLARFRDDFARLQAEDQRISQEIQSRSQGGESQSGGR
ncbi:MAG: hypothetical protein QOF89_5093 [Acidobacteriota bacterium]|jgi:hypothetical protein|nr:hypothetical protein [Acidobacteriota bacterium]